MSAEVSLDGIRWVRLTFIDVFGTSNSMQIPAGRLADAIERGVPFDGSALEGRARLIESDMLLRPDRETLLDVGAGVARATCAVHTPDGARWPGDPRFALEILLEDVPPFLTGMTVSGELEFYLLDGEGAPIDDAGYFDEVDGPGNALVREAGDRLLASGVPIESCHHEAGPGQYELDVGPLPPFRLADALVLAKQVVRDLAAVHEVRATFMPRPFDDLPGSGLHLHQRFADAFDGDGGLQPEARSFVAGELEHARAVSAIAAPTVNSYKRLHSGPEAPGAIVWAHMNRAALLRVSSFRGVDATIEYRGADASANPYLLLGALVAAGCDGLARALELATPAEETLVGFDPLGTKRRLTALPRDLDEALDALLADDVIVDAFADQLLGRLVDGRRAESEIYRSLVTDWERSRYLETA
jgi:glutamine synthetase